MSRDDIFPLFWILDLLLWISYIILLINISRCLYFLSATYVTEPGIIPKGEMLTVEQIRKITETPSNLDELL